MAKRPGKIRYRVAGTDDIDYVSDTVPDPEFAGAVAAMLQQMASESVHQWGWDVPPLLVGFYLRGRSPIGSIGPGGWRNMEIECVPFPGATEALMRSQRNHHVMVGLAMGLQADPDRPQMPDNLMAVGLLTEGWTVVPKDEADSQRLRDLGGEQKLHEQPDRVEVKIFSAVDVNGVRYGYVRPRDTSIAPHGWAGMWNDETALGGEVPTSLHYLIEAIQGRSLPDYETWSDAHDREAKQA